VRTNRHPHDPAGLLGRVEGHPYRPSTERMITEHPEIVSGRRDLGNRCGRTHPDSTGRQHDGRTHRCRDSQELLHSSLHFTPHRQRLITLAEIRGPTSTAPPITRGHAHRTIDRHRFDRQLHRAGSSPDLPGRRLTWAGTERNRDGFREVVATNAHQPTRN